MEDASALIVLKSTPPVISVATCNGKVHHAMLLSFNDNENEVSYFGYQCVDIAACSSKFGGAARKILLRRDHTCHTFPIASSGYEKSIEHGFRQLESSQIPVVNNCTFSLVNVV